MSQEGTVAKAQFISQSDVASGYSHAISADLAHLDLPSLCGSSIEKAQLASRRVSLDVGRYDVVLEPHVSPSSWSGCAGSPLRRKALRTGPRSSRGTRVRR